MGAPMAGTERLEAAKVRERFGEALLGVKEHAGETYLLVARDSLPELVKFLKEDPELDYGYFAECLGVDYSTWDDERDLPGRFEVVYNLFSLKHNSRLFVKVGVDDGQTVPTLRHVFLGAEYPEREVQDLFGVVFEGNCRMKGQELRIVEKSAVKQMGHG